MIYRPLRIKPGAKRGITGEPCAILENRKGGIAMLSTGQVLVLYAIWFPLALGFAAYLLKKNS